MFPANSNEQTSRLRIGLVVDTYARPISGVTIAARRFTKCLRERGHEVYILSADPPNLPYGISFPSFCPPVVGRMLKQKNVLLARPLRNRMRSVVEKLDVLHVLAPSWFGWQAIRESRSLHKPVIATFQLQAENLLRNTNIRSQRLVKAIYSLFLDQIYNLVDEVICPTEFAQLELMRYGLTSPTSVISNGIPDHFRPTPVIRPPQWSDRFIILTVGRLAKEKCHQRLIDAIAVSQFANNIQLVIVGEGPLQEALQIQGARLPNSPVITSVSEDELIRYYNMADLYVHASEVETEGIAILEAMGCGIPVLVAQSPVNAAENLGLNDSSYFCFHDDFELASKIDNFIRQPEVLNASKQRSYQKAGQFSLDASVDLLEALYYKHVRSGTD